MSLLPVKNLQQKKSLFGFIKGLKENPVCSLVSLSTTDSRDIGVHVLKDPNMAAGGVWGATEDVLFFLGSFVSNVSGCTTQILWSFADKGGKAPDAGEGQNRWDLSSSTLTRWGKVEE